MTIVDSINKLTSDLGGTPTGKNTIQEAIDELNPVLVSKTSGGGGGGGTSFGTVTVTEGVLITDPTTIELEGLSSADDYLESGLDYFIEPAKITFISGSYKYTAIGTHEFSLYGSDYQESFSVTYGDLMYNAMAEREALIFITRTLYRVHSDGAWGDWTEYSD